MHMPEILDVNRRHGTKLTVGKIEWPLEVFWGFADEPGGFLFSIIQ